MNRRERRAAARARDERIRAGGLDPDALRAWADSELMRVTPPGWKTRKVVPPWVETGGQCRSCGGGQKWIIIMLTRLMPAEKVVLFTFAFVCPECLQDGDKTRELGERAFAMQ